MKPSKYIIGIDLGTTHSVLAYAEAPEEEYEELQIRIFHIPQLVSPGEVKERALFPSALFLPGPHDVPEGGLALPWDDEADYAIGEYARKRGAEIPNRFVSSVKSWLCHNGVDRTKPILPWDSPKETRRVSPVEASSLLLKHIRDAWNYYMAEDDLEALLENQNIYLTVPASFDAVARELTVQAAQAAGLEHLTILEEPQAAFYAWIESQGEKWRKSVRVGESLLVCDIGGGTTDFSLIQVTEENGDLALRRVAVGDHILLGGDNMDLALACAVRADLTPKGTHLDSWQFRGLWHGCQQAKERLLGQPDLESEPVTILGRGSSLIGGTIRTELTRDDVERVLQEGFFPLCAPSDFPSENPKVGLREMGLSYGSDPAVTHHLAKFLARHVGHNGNSSDIPYPSAVLFNGGVMKSAPLRKRVISLLKQWREDDDLRELESVDLDMAVARGAAYYGLASRGRGVRIRAGASRTYYIGVESAFPSVPGFTIPIKALCVVPFGMEEGVDIEIREKEFGLVIGQNAVFSLFDSVVRKKDKAGEIIEDWHNEIDEVSSMETLLDPSSDDQKGAVLPIWLHSKFTEIGTLELWCVACDGDQRWKLEFNLRESDQA